MDVPNPGGESGPSRAPLVVVHGRQPLSLRLRDLLLDLAEAGRPIWAVDLSGTWMPVEGAQVWQPVDSAGHVARLPRRRARWGPLPLFTADDGQPPRPLADLLARAVDVLAGDEWAAAIVQRAAPDLPVPRPWRAAERAQHWKRVEHLAASFDEFPSSGSRQVQAAAALADGLADLETTPQEFTSILTGQSLTDVGEILARSVRTRALDLLIDSAVSLWGESAAASTGLSALSASSRLSEGGSVPQDLQACVAATLAGAEQAWTAGNLDHAAAITSAALRLLFHPALHSESARSELIDDPVGFLGVFLDSAVGRAITTHPRVPEQEGGTTAPTVVAPRPRRVAVLPGSYPQFAAGVVQALQEDPSVECTVVDVTAETKLLRYLGVNTAMIRHRLAQAAGQEVRLAPQSLAQAAQADVVVVDWADRAAWWATTHLPTETRIVVRIHAADALSVWILMVDWSRVSDLIFVSPAFRDVVVDLLGERLRQTQVHVVPSGVDLEQFSPGDASEDDREFTLGMIGWGRPVKDPLFAVETLALLREHDPRWRLQLVGPDLAEVGTPTARRYHEEFETRVRRPDVAGAVERYGASDDVAEQARGMSHLLSSSRREGLPFAVIEGVACGAVPVIRDWPALASRNGARGAFPAAWVVSTPRQAADRVIATTTERTRVSAECMAQVQERYDMRLFGQRIRDVVLGGATAP